jgi:hypothetical protein
MMGKDTHVRPNISRHLVWAKPALILCQLVMQLCILLPTMDVLVQQIKNKHIMHA